VSASSVAGTGQNRTVTMNDPYIFANVTVVVPAALDNSTADSFAFLVADESGTSVNYTFNVTVYDNNVTWYNGTVDIISIADDNVTDYVNFTALTFAAVDDANISIVMLFTDNWTQADMWYGEIDILTNSDYTLTVYLIQIMTSLLGTLVVVVMIVKLTKSFDKQTKKTGKKK